MWTWEKILECEEIKRGVLVSSKQHNMLTGIVLNKIISAELLVSDDDGEARFFTSTTNYSKFKFFNRNGEEILPPKERETITLYETLDMLGVKMCDENGFLPDFKARKKVVCHNEYAKLRKANINKNKSVVLYVDTFEVKEWRN